MKVLIAPEVVNKPQEFKASARIGDGMLGDVPDNGAEAWAASGMAWEWLHITGSSTAHIYDVSTGTKLAFVQRIIYE